MVSKNHVVAVFLIGSLVPLLPTMSLRAYHSLFENLNSSPGVTWVSVVFEETARVFA